MSTLTAPTPKNDILRALAKSRAPVRPSDFQPASPLADHPALAHAAAGLSGKLDTGSDAFAGVAACLETLTRLKLGARNGRTLVLLAKNGPMTVKALTLQLNIPQQSSSNIFDRLETLSLVKRSRSATDDGREVLAEITPAGESVLASIVALTALGQAANVLTKTGHRAAGQDRQKIAFTV
jgi:DNA-binding MarR family transcriptional regulator